MPLLPPSEVVSRRERVWAWPLFFALVLIFAGYVTTSIILAQQARDHPPISQQYKIEDWPLPDFYITSQAFLNPPYSNDILVKNIAVMCGLSTQRVVGPFLNISSGTRAPLNWNLTRTEGQSSFFYNSGSNCLVTTLNHTDPGDGPSRFYFVFHTGNFSVPREMITVPGAFLTLSVFWTYASAVSDPNVVAPFLRSARVVGAYGLESLDAPFASTAQETGVQYTASMGTTIFEYLNQPTRKAATIISNRRTTSAGDPWPIQDWVVTTLSLDSLGTLYVQEKNPVNPTILISQVASAWAFMMLVFGMFFSFEQKRNFAFSGMVSYMGRVVSGRRDVEMIVQRAEDKEDVDFCDKS